MVQPEKSKSKAKQGNEYGEVDDIWPHEDKWHCYTRSRIDNFIKAAIKKLDFSKGNKLLNAGSAGNEYELRDFDHYHVDISEKNIKAKVNSFVSTIERVPLDDQLFDICLCVGSVINYCDAMRAINEISRLLRPGSTLILEYEKSRSFEFIGEKCFNKSAHMADTFYKSEAHRIWVYSEKYIANLLEVNHFKINFSERIHILSPLLYRIFKDDRFAAKFSKGDSFLKRVPIVRTFSSNVILSCQKAS